MRTLKPGTARAAPSTAAASAFSLSLLGTPWEPHTEGKLLFLEDTGVKPYQVDRMLWQLRQAGKLEGVRGILFGEMLDCASPGAPAESARRGDSQRVSAISIFPSRSACAAAMSRARM